MAQITIPNVSLSGDSYNYAENTINRWRKSWANKDLTLVSANPAAIAGQSDEYDIVIEGEEKALTKKVKTLLKSWFYEQEDIDTVLATMKK